MQNAITELKVNKIADTRVPSTGIVQYSVAYKERKFPHKSHLRTATAQLKTRKPFDTAVDSFSQ